VSWCAPSAGTSFEAEATSTLSGARYAVVCDKLALRHVFIATTTQLADPVFGEVDVAIAYRRPATGGKPAHLHDSTKTIFKCSASSAQYYLELRVKIADGAEKSADVRAPELSWNPIIALICERSVCSAFGMKFAFRFA
jgi:hypothetical protein